MVRYVSFGILLALTALGCDRGKDPFLRKVEKEADRAIRRLGEPNVRDPLFRVDKLIESETNRAVRAACYRILQDKVLAVELKGDDYDRLSRTFWWGWVVLMPYRWNETRRWTIEDESHSKVRQLRWMRQELDRWKAMASNGEAARLKKENLEKFKSWRRSYRKCLSDYETYVASFERIFDSDCKRYNANDAERIRAKAFVEAFLGRPMRTREEVLRDRQERKTSDEMQALQ